MNTLDRVVLYLCTLGVVLIFVRLGWTNRHLHQFTVVNRKITRKVLKNQEEVMGKVDDILNEVNELDDINDSMDALFAKLQELINQGNPDNNPALAQALEILVAQKARTKAAILANTPAAPPSPPDNPSA